MRSPSRTDVIVLCSGFGLGFYVPGLLIREKLRGMGFTCGAAVFEELLPPTKLEMVEKNRRAYHESFRVALASQKVPGDARTSIDHAKMESLLDGWQRRDCRHFICLSGHWVHVLDRYRDQLLGGSISVDLLYLDADPSPSWKWLQKINPNYAAGYREMRLYDRDPKTACYSIDTNMAPPVPFDSRDRRLVVHGGGWGIGTFNESVSDIQSAGYGLDLVCYAEAEAVTASAGRRFFMDDPSWRTWHRDRAGELTFPPFGRVMDDGPSTFTVPQRCNGLHSIIRRTMGIVSKPGAGTLIDSMGSATPLIVLEPFGPHEERNAEVWLASGFGLPYRVWADAGHPASMLEELHLQLVEHRRRLTDYAEYYSRTVLVSS
jgi:hypothetical protein